MDSKSQTYSCVCVCVCEQLWCFEPSRLYQVKGIRGKEMEHLHQALVSKKIRQTERESECNTF